MQLLNYQENPSQLTVNFGSNGQQIPYFNLLENGQVIATSNQITLTDTSADQLSAPVTQTIDITLNGVTSSPFYQEINQLTNGTDVLALTGTTPNGTAGITGYTFTFSGDAVVQALTTPSTTTQVPEPTTILGTGIALIIGSMLKRKSRFQA